MPVYKSTLALFVFMLCSCFGFAQAPVAHFTSDCKILCLGGSSGIGNNELNFVYDGTGGTPTYWAWTFPGGTPSSSTAQNPGVITFSTAGTYLISVRAGNAVDTTTFIDTVFALNNCSANVSVVTGPDVCTGSCINFIDKSNFRPDTWSWTFNNGSGTPITSFDEDPTNICYNNVGHYTVQLTASRSNTACFTQASFSSNLITVMNCAPFDSAVINYSGSCVGNAIVFSSVFKGGGFGVTYNWSFPGGNIPTSSGSTVSEIYNTTGVYTVQLILRDASNHIDTVTQTINIQNCASDSILIDSTGLVRCLCSSFQLPFTIKATFAGDNVFTAYLSDTSGHSYAIGYFDDSVAGNIPVTIPCNIAPGSKYSMHIEGSDPSLIGEPVSVTVVDTPTSAFTVSKSTTCTGANIKLTYTGSSSNEAKYTWGFNGGIAVPDTGKGPLSVNWTTSGTKTPSLIVADGGCTSTQTTQTVSVTASPTATFTLSPDSTCINDIVTLTYTGDASSAATYRWNFDYANPNTGTGQGPQNVSWPSPDTYHPTLTVTANGCTSAPDTQLVAVGLCAGIDNISSPSSTLQVYPNPAWDKLSVISYSLLGGTLQIMDVLGKTVLIKEPTDNETTIDVSQLNPGLYFLSVKYADGDSEVRKFVKE